MVAKTKLSRSVEGEELTLRKRRKRKRCTGVFQADHPTKSKNKRREEEREREGRVFSSPGFVGFRLWRKCRGKTGAVTWELLFAEWGNQWEGHDDLAVTWYIQ